MGEFRNRFSHDALTDVGRERRERRKLQSYNACERERKREKKKRRADDEIVSRL
jgi:hypothetical protein